MSDISVPPLAPAPLAPEATRRDPQAELPGDHRSTASPLEQARTPPPEETVAGPPPAFEANLLDLTQNIEALIRDIRNTREAARMAYSSPIGPTYFKT